MNHAARFGYAQARLQARHGARADEQLWRRLASVGDFTSYLQAARRSTLRPWVLGIQVTESSHSIELHLRQQFRRYVDEVAQWLPAHWGDSVRWVKRLPDLPALQYLMNGEVAPAWMLEDPELRLFASETVALRLESMRNSDVNPLLAAWQRGSALPEAWLEQWQQLWPVQPTSGCGLTYLARLLSQHIQLLHSAPSVPTGHQRSHIEHRLTLAFRRYSLEPAAACAHLGLIALDLEKLRGELAFRLLFTETAQLPQ
jgi:hypothetical protein